MVLLAFANTGLTFKDRPVWNPPLLGFDNRFITLLASDSFALERIGASLWEEHNVRNRLKSLRRHEAEGE